MISHRISTFMILRAANRKRRAVEAERETRAHLNRPHVQSAHMIGHFVPPRVPTARDFGVTRRYVVALLFFAGAVVTLNVYFPKDAEAQMFACAPQMARN